MRQRRGIKVSKHVTTWHCHRKRLRLLKLLNGTSRKNDCLCLGIPTLFCFARSKSKRTSDEILLPPFVIVNRGYIWTFYNNTYQHTIRRTCSLEQSNIRLSEKCLSFIDTSFTTMHLYTNMKPNLSNVVIFVLIE